MTGNMDEQIQIKRGTTPNAIGRRPVRPPTQLELIADDEEDAA